MTRTCICIFAKPPRPGFVKTRLARSMGTTTSAELAGVFLRDVWGMAQQIPDVRVVLASTDVTARDDQLGEIERWPQGDGGLGYKLQRVLERGLCEHRYVVALGGDSPDLPGALIKTAIRALEDVDAVLSPAQDGGFVLLAVRRLPASALHDLPWSATHTCDATVARLAQCGLSVRLLDGWDDVDTEADLQNLARRLAKGSVAPRTRQFLRGRGLMAFGESL